MKINRETSDKRNLCYYDEAIVQRRLKRSKRQLKQKHGQLTDDDLTFAERKDDELLGCLQKKRGKSTEDLRKEIEQPVNSGFDINDPNFLREILDQIQIRKSIKPPLSLQRL